MINYNNNLKLNKPYIGLVSFISIDLPSLILCLFLIHTELNEQLVWSLLQFLVEHFTKLHWGSARTHVLTLGIITTHITVFILDAFSVLRALDMVVIECKVMVDAGVSVAAGRAILLWRWTEHLDHLVHHNATLVILRCLYLLLNLYLLINEMSVIILDYQPRRRTRSSKSRWFGTHSHLRLLHSNIPPPKLAAASITTSLRYCRLSSLSFSKFSLKIRPSRSTLVKYQSPTATSWPLKLRNSCPSPVFNRNGSWIREDQALPVFGMEIGGLRWDGRARIGRGGGCVLEGADLSLGGNGRGGWRWLVHIVLLLLLQELRFGIRLSLAVVRCQCWDCRVGIWWTDSGGTVSIA